MAKLSRLENRLWAIDLDSALPQIEGLQVYYRIGDVGFLISPQALSDSRIIYADDLGASFIVPAATSAEPLRLVILDKSGNLVRDEILYFPSNLFTNYLDLAGANFNPTWSKHIYKKTSDIAIFTRIYNEFEFVDIFLKHYIELTDPSNIFLIDHSSDNTGFYRLAEQYGCQVLKIPRGDTDETNMKTFCEYFQRFLLTKYSHVIYADIDELLIHRQGAAHFRKLLLEDEWRGLYMPAHAHEVYHEPNKEAEFDFTKKITAQREYLVPNRHFHKPTVTSVTAHWGPGFHEAFNLNKRGLKELWMIHIKYISAAYRVKRELERASEQRSPMDAARGVTIDRFNDAEAQYEKVKALFLQRIYEGDPNNGPTIKVPDWMVGQF